MLGVAFLLLDLCVLAVGPLLAALLLTASPACLLHLPVWTCLLHLNRRAERPLESLHTNLDASITLLRASLAESKAAAAARKAAAAAAAIRSSSSSLRPASAPKASHSRNPVSCAECPSARSAMAKHLMRYNTEEVRVLPVHVVL